MKKIFLVVYAVVFSTGLFAAKGLVVTQTYTDVKTKGASVTVTWYVTENQCKMKMTYADEKMNSTTYFIPDPANAQLLTYSDGVAPGAGEKKYYTVPVQGIKSSIDASGVSVTQTSETKTIGGLQCLKVIVKTNSTTTEMWVTQDFKGGLYKFSSFFQNSYELLGLNHQSLQGVPLESVTKDSSGKVINSFQFVSAVSSDFGADDFTVPSAYKNSNTTGK